MIERVYIDNYKSFVNFELQPQAAAAHRRRQWERQDRALRRPREHPRFSDRGEHNQPEFPYQSLDSLG